MFGFAQNRLGSIASQAQGLQAQEQQALSGAQQQAASPDAPVAAGMPPTAPQGAQDGPAQPGGSPPPSSVNDIIHSIAKLFGAGGAAPQGGPDPNAAVNMAGYGAPGAAGAGDAVNMSAGSGSPQMIQYLASLFGA